MPTTNVVPNIEKLHTLATQPISDIPTTARMEEDYNGVDIYVDYHNDLEVARSGGCTVIRGVLGDVHVGDIGEGAVVTVSFDGDSAEPTTFLRWDRIRSDSGEGFSIPKRQREKIAGHLIDRFTA